MELDVGEWLGRHVYVTGEYEPATTSLITELLSPGDVFLDIGANIGYFTLLAAKQVGSNGRVFSFEPVPSIRQQLEDNVRLNRHHQCDIRDVAVSNDEGTCEFFSGPLDHTGISSLRKIDRSSDTILVRTARLDSVLPHDLAISVVKIDVEGAECHVLEGMKETLRRCSPEIIIEVSPSFLAEMGKSVGQIDQLLVAHGYRSYAIEHNGLRPLTSLTAYRSAQFNAFLTSRSSVPKTFRILDADE